jgi:superfamily I DNA and/or RNA helicase/transcription elongation GreA/GreB family factor/very-short-patch-repair endonuclease
MEITEKLLIELQNRLKVGSRRGVHLNAIPARSRYKFDLTRLSHIDKDLPKKFINSLLTEQPLKFKISWKDNVPDLNSLFEEDQAQLVKITKSFENLINQTAAIESEKGLNTFGFGFPLLIRRDQLDKKLTVAPILIWSLRIKRSKDFNTWVIHRDEDDPIYINEVLINHLQNDSKIEIEKISSDFLDDGLIDKDELLDICVNILETINTTIPDNIRGTLNEKLENIKSISDKKYYEKLTLTSNNSFIEFGGLFSIFEVQKQNIIHDYENMLDLEGATIDLDDMEEHTFQPISSVETDPSQQGILHSLENTRNILIQGPPGTGKSQSLTAILVNALENKKKTIVVCEKRTALEVLYNSLNEKGLNYQCVLIKDIVKDRRAAVNSVRDRIDNSSYRRYRYTYSKENLDGIIDKAKSLIDSINKKHIKLGEKLVGNKNWTRIVGELLSELKGNEEDYNLEIEKGVFKYESTELNELLELIRKGQLLYNDFKPNKKFSFLNHLKLVGENPFIIEQKIKNDFKDYEEEFRGTESKIKLLLDTNKDNPDFFDLEKTNSYSYKFISLFSKKNKKTITDQKLIYDYCINLVERIKKDNWVKQSINEHDFKSIIKDIKSIIISYNNFFNHKNDLFFIEFKWFQFYNGASGLEKLIIDQLLEKENWKKVFLLHYLNSMLVNSANTDLPTNDNDHKELSNSLSNLEQEQLKYIKEYWYSKQIDATRDFDNEHHNLAVENLYNKKAGTKHKRLSLRQIVEFDIDLFTTFFPIILTTPDVCSNLFKGKNKYFDIVMFDEASQLKLEDNLPALLKGKQVIIAGDEHQMPPSNYFSKIFDGSIDDEDEFEDESGEKIFENGLLSAESLLEFAEELNFEKKHLDFHYRSRHPYLIDFSNYAFYNQRLKPLPNSFEYTPIKYIQVNGTYSDHTNDVEAETVLSILENNINRLPNGEYPSVGIATFNIHQRNLILSKINDRRKFEMYADFNEKILELEEGGLFVKNLENIQGDERDVIILTTTYGFNKDGKFAQRFGSINHQKGYKLLNVIITRAKYKVYVCSSIPEEVFLNYKEHLSVEGSNNRRAVFFAYLAYSKAVSENDSEQRLSILNALTENSTKSSNIDILNADLESPFEEEVYQALTDYFEESNIIPQLQFAGFRIDIVYDSKILGIPKIAIECDGAAYHSSQEAYLYDKHRQNILERHGFVFHRIWSTNWWRNPKREINKLVKFIKSIENSNPSIFEDKSKTGLAFTDDIKIANGNFQKNSPEIQKEVKETIETISKNKVIQTDLFKDAVKIGSKVKVKYLNNGKDLKVQIVEEEINKSEKSNGIQKVNNKSPLAVAIIGKGVGETAKVGNLDNYIEILEIIN